MTNPLIAAFPKGSEFEKARTAVERLSLPYGVVSPDPGFRRVGAPSLVLDEGAYRTLYARFADTFTCSGWVDYRPATIRVPETEPPAFAEDVFGEAAVMVLAPCVADASKIRIIAHISGNLDHVFPYMNAVMKEACYNRNGPTFTFMMGYRMIAMYPRRIAVAKADEMVDAWRALDVIRCRVNDVWARHTEIEPSYEMRQKPPALEIFKRLPRTNCRHCGERTCLAFAVKLWNGDGELSDCKPVFAGEYGRLRPALIEICRGLGVAEGKAGAGLEYDMGSDLTGVTP